MHEAEAHSGQEVILHRGLLYVRYYTGDLYYTADITLGICIKQAPRWGVLTLWLLFHLSLFIVFVSSFIHLMTSGDEESREGDPHSWDGGMASPTMEEHFYPFLIERRPSYLEEDDEERGEEDLSLALERKDKDLLLAAELGKALLERNDYLEKSRESLEEELRNTRERLEQEKHALRLKMEAKDGEWKAQITDLESDLFEAQHQVRQLLSEHKECGRESATAVQELSEQNQRLVEQLAQASQVEKSLVQQLESLKEENRDLTQRRGQFTPVLQSLQSENTLLLEKKRDMESQINILRGDNESAQNVMLHLKETAQQLERQKNETDVKMLEKSLEVEVLRDSQRSLQIQVIELQDELKLRDNHFPLQENRYSLHSEMQETSGGSEHEVRKHHCLCNALLPQLLFPMTLLVLHMVPSSVLHMALVISLPHCLHHQSPTWPPITSPPLGPCVQSST
ncbi:unnamed protein product [Ranitomeya imitator]|uniref:BICD family-like cargo adapter 2 n=1 Tax=Ranitomeya imitator TaxID=111125 RepID=A0ABN9M2D5_9NEOB|nr:unnamed protein product [Ranitomeya imitator]